MVKDRPVPIKQEIFFFVGWGETSPIVRRPLIGLLLKPRIMDEYGVFGGMRIGRGKPKYSEKSRSSAIFSITNLI
jgi:hypothetical protein